MMMIEIFFPNMLQWGSGSQCLVQVALMFINHVNGNQQALEVPWKDSWSTILFPTKKREGLFGGVADTDSAIEV